MFVVKFENTKGFQWDCEYIFEDYEDAKKYLKLKGFTEKGVLFEREVYNWCDEQKAYILPRKIYKTLNNRLTNDIRL